ncbi:MAG: hypothetical protein OEX02_01595, partial [Cyclobacteriaceae bacterium]|nr:hypothetical protein [Cyclobacteriaceae bacterium]
NKGYYYYLTGEYNDAARLLEQSAQMDPFTEKVFLFLGNTYYKMDRTKDACTAWEKSISQGDKEARDLMALHCDE